MTTIQNFEIIEKILKPGNFKLKIPSDWTVKKLSDVVLRIENGLVYSQTESNELNRAYPITRIETISDGIINSDRVGYVENVSAQNLSRFSLNEGDLLFSHINSIEHVGKTAIYLGIPRPLIHGMNLLRIVTNKELNPFYLYHWTKDEFNRSRFRSISQPAINQVSINITQLKNLEIPLPSSREQGKIVSILSNIDKLIQKTNQIIEQTQKLKEGLMQRLLTKGIEHSKFKDTELGKIPEKWGVVKLGEIANVSTGGTPSTSIKEFYEGEIPFIKTSEIVNNVISTSSVYISKKAVEKQSLRLYPRKTVLLAMYGQGKTRGQSSILGIEAATSQNAAAIVADKNRLDSYYLWYYLLHNYNKLRGIGNIGHVSHLNLSFVKSLKLPLPPVSEQQKIESILSRISLLIEKLKDKKKSEDKLKSGLMQRLLTGNLRVRV